MLPIRAVLVTIVAMAGIGMLHWIPVPGLDLEPLEKMLGVDLPNTLSMGSIGVAPVLNAFILVEIVALIVPRWRPLRTRGASGRATLRKAVVGVAVVLTAIQSFFLLKWLGNAPLMYGVPLFPNGWNEITQTGIAATLVGGTLATLILVVLAGRFGLGNGFSVLFATTVVYELVEFGRDSLAGYSDPMKKGDLSEWLIRLGVVVVITALAFRASPRGIQKIDRDRSEARSVTPIPLAGVIPILAITHLLSLINQLIVFSDAFADLEGWILETELAFFGVNIAVVVATSLVFGALFFRSRDGHKVGARQHALTLLVSVAVIVVANLSPPFVFNAAAVMIVTGVAYDLVAEWRFRSTHGGCLSICEFQHVHASSDVAWRLECAGIPTLLRSYRHRSLLHFFGPEIPIEVVVPLDRVDQARQVMDDVQRPGFIKTASAGCSGSLGRYS